MVELARLNVMHASDGGGVFFTMLSQTFFVSPFKKLLVEKKEPRHGYCLGIASKV